jgi:hypothetical protein
MYGYDMNTGKGRLQAMAHAAAEDYGYTYNGRIDEFHVFEKDTSHGTVVLKCTDWDIRDSLLPIMLQQQFTR